MQNYRRVKVKARDISYSNPMKTYIFSSKKAIALMTQNKAREDLDPELINELSVFRPGSI